MTNTPDLQTLQVQLEYAWLVERDNFMVQALAADYPLHTDALFDHFIDVLLGEYVPRLCSRAETTRLREGRCSVLREAGYNALAGFMSAPGDAQRQDTIVSPAA